jgi:signal transduction histidine kinase
MPFSRYRTWIPLIAFLLMGSVFIVELTSHVLITVAYIGLASYTFWMAEKNSHIILVGLLATVLMTLGYVLVIDKTTEANQLTVLINRAMGIIVVWFAYYFTIRYRKIREDELRQRNEIAESELREERLRSSQEMYKAIAQNFPEGWIGILDEDLKYVFADGKGLDRMLLSANHLVGRRFKETVKSELAEEPLKQAQHGISVSFEIECSSHTCVVNAGPFLNGHSGNWILVVVHDITELKKAETELIKALDKERELGELKSRFVTLASHEFRTPLTTILSSSFLLESYTGEKYEKEKSTHIGRIRRSVKILTEMLNDFLSLGRLEEGEIKTRHEEINLFRFLEDMTREVESLRRGDQILRVRHTGAADIISDRQLLRNIIYNLASNAFKYTHHEDQVLIETLVADGDLTIRITDHGMGIPEEEQKYIFKRFYRAHNSTHIQGTGLGLNIVRKYVNLLGGTIHFESRPEESTVFTVQIPVKVEATSEAEIVL